MTTIKCSDVSFNIEIKLEETSGQSNVDFVVDRHTNGEERVIIIIQHVKTPKISDTLIGVLVIEINTNKRSFTIVNAPYTFTEIYGS